MPVRYRAPASQPDIEFPLVLNTGRIRGQWHSMTRTGLAPRLGGHLPEPYISVNPNDAGRCQLLDGALADVASRQGRIRVRVQLSDQIATGQVFVPMHWTDIHASRARVASLVAEHCDPDSGQPENKYTPVKITPWWAKSEALLVSREPLADPATDYWAMRRVNGGYLYRLASALAPSELDAHLQTLAGQSEQQLAFGQPEKGAFRRALSRQGRLHLAYSLAGCLAGADWHWLGDLLDGDFAANAMRALLRGVPDAAHSGGKQVCACKQVGYNTLCKAVREQGADSVEALSRATQAGTGCGSCLPELERIIARERADAAA